MNKLLLISVLSVLIISYGCTKSEDGITEIIPLAPSNLTATASTQVSLQWTDNSTNESGFKIERKTSATNFISVGTTDKDVSNFNDTQMALGINYTYRVFAYNQAGNSPNYSNEVTVTSSNFPTLTTNSVSNLGSTIATSGGIITSNGGMAVIARGVCWSTSSSPTIALNTKTSDAQGNGNYTSNITNLTPATKYYVRAYATNAVGTNYGNEINFTTNTTAIPSCLKVSTVLVDSITQSCWKNGKDNPYQLYRYEDRVTLIDQNGAPINSSSTIVITLTYKRTFGTGGHNTFNQIFTINQGTSVSDKYSYSDQITDSSSPCFKTTIEAYYINSSAPYYPKCN
jgi:hypothetical protein